MKKKVMGDIESFSGQRDDFFDVMGRKVATHGDNILEIPLDKITVGENVRVSEENIDELAESIETKGLLQPIVVVETEPGRFKIVFGHRRFRAHQVLVARNPERFGKIAAVSRKVEDFEADEIHEVQLVENIQRENLSSSELRDALEYLRAKGLTSSEIAKRIGKSDGYVKNMFMSIHTLKDNPDLSALMEGKSPQVTLRDVMDVRMLPHKEQISVLTQKLSGEIKTQAELVARVKDLKERLYAGHGEKKQKPPSPLFEIR
ncbi:MAG: ParB/RepB/Spo0J family partition protein, partial [Spirochaetia bacterium]|nr:ParB/RepB/Spo0J family partition protein [Spirochaetia bacterium]